MDSTRRMALLDLQKELSKEIENILEDMMLKQPSSPELIPIKAYGQALPIPERLTNAENYSNEDLPEEEADIQKAFPFPWALIKLDRGIVRGIGEPQIVYVVIVFGIFDDGKENQGHEAVLIMIERVMERFAKDPLLSGQIMAVPIDNNHMFNWSMQDEDTYPYFYGALEMAFYTPGFQREDRYGFA